jgi:hypothetical protein
MNRLPARLLSLVAAASVPALCLAPSPTSAQGTPSPGVLKLHSRGTTSKVNNEFGSAVAVSDTWMVVGEPFNSDSAANAGATYVYAATTGRFVRRLTPVPAPGASSFFGTSVAISGSLALIGVDGESDDRGAAYVFDLRTGRQLARLTAEDAGIDDFFGNSVALNGDLALVGAPGLIASAPGAAYLFHARTGAQLGKLTASNGAIGHQFGSSVALSGSLALVGAPRAFGDNGAAYTYDVSGAFLPGAVFPELAILTANDGAAGDRFGRAVSLSGHRALIGAENQGITFRGKAYLFDARNSTAPPLRTFELADAADFDSFGTAVALNGNLAVIGSPGRSTAFFYDASTGREIARLTPPDATESFANVLAVSGNQVLVGAREDEDLGNEAGAAYLYRPVSVPLPLTAVAKVGDFAPGTVETNFTGFTAAYLNADAEVGLSATLSNRRRGVWSEDTGVLRPSLPEGVLAPGVSLAGIGEIIPEDIGGPLFQATLRSNGFSPRNRVFWLRNNGSTAPFEVLIQGRPYDEVNGSPALLTFPEVVQRSDSGHVLAAYTLARSTTTGTTLANDSGVTFRNASGNVDGAVVSDTRHREGEAAATGTVGDTYGQFFGRAALSPGNVFFAFPAFYLDTSPADPLPDVVRQGVFYDTLDSDTMGVVARQGQSPVGLPGVPGPTYRAFLGELMSDSVFAAFRALVTGTGITRLNDEGIFSEQTKASYLWEGQTLALPNAPGLVIAGFLGYWPVDGDGKIIALVKLRGPGVTKANDCAVVLAGRVDNYLQVLLREGDLAGADDASRIATIQRVDANSVNGHYHILVSLTGSKARNQALFQGNAELGNDTTLKGRRLAAMVLRKGQGYQQPSGETSTIKTLTMPVSTDRTGAGAKGHGQAINNQGDVVVTLEFANRSREVWKGRP